MKPTLLILAAGMGSRYGGLKQIDGIGPGRETIIEYSVYDAIKAGFGKAVFVIRPDIEQVFKEKIANKFEDKIRIEYAFQEIDSPIKGIAQFPVREKPWGTAHAVLVAKDKINEPFAIINADDYYGTSAFKTMANFLRNDCNPNHYAMVAYIVKNTLSDHGTVSRGICEMDHNQNLTKVVERFKVHRRGNQVFCQDERANELEISPDALVSMNFWGFHPSAFERMRQQFVQFVAQHGDHSKAEFYIPLFAQDQIDRGTAKIAVLSNHEQWYGVTYQEDKEAVQKAFKELTDKGTYPNPLWKMAELVSNRESR